MNRHLLLERFTPTWLGGILECHGVLDSTNQRARQILDHLGPAGHGAVVFADEQTGGRGRQGRSWHSPRGLGVSCSVALWAKDRPGGLQPFQLCGSLATLSAIRGTTGLTAGLKWPNDVFLSGRKVSGVIVETRFLGDSPAGLVLGIGVNLLHRTEDFPPELRATATSLLLTSGREVEPETFAGALLNALAPLVEKGLENPAALVALAGPHWIHRLGDPLAVVTGSGSIRGTFSGVGRDGALLLDVDGERRAVHDGEVIRLRPAGAGAEGLEPT